MATITSKIIEKWENELIQSGFLGNPNKMLSPREQRYLTDRVGKIIELKKKTFYQKIDKFKGIREVMLSLGNHDFGDSKAEGIVYFMLKDAGVSFQFQRQIGPYRVDFLINELIILELDGPHHKKQRGYDADRDKYLEKMGYEVVRVPIWLMASAGQIVIKELQAKGKEEVPY